jgi:hypothetical protein
MARKMLRDHGIPIRHDARARPRQHSRNHFRPPAGQRGGRPIAELNSYRSAGSIRMPSCPQALPGRRRCDSDAHLRAWPPQRRRQPRFGRPAQCPVLRWTAGIHHQKLPLCRGRGQHPASVHPAEHNGDFVRAFLSAAIGCHCCVMTRTACRPRARSRARCARRGSCPRCSPTRSSRRCSRVRRCGGGSSG